jgi:hypothetical protein
MPTKLLDGHRKCKFRPKAKSVYTIVVAWAADYFIVESCRRLVNRTVIVSEDFWADAEKLKLREMLSVIFEGLQFSDQDAVTPKFRCLLAFLKEQLPAFVQEWVTACVLAAVIAHHPVRQKCSSARRVWIQRREPEIKIYGMTWIQQMCRIR